MMLIIDIFVRTYLPYDDYPMISQMYYDWFVLIVVIFMLVIIWLVCPFVWANMWVFYSIVWVCH